MSLLAVLFFPLSFCTMKKPTPVTNTSKGNFTDAVFGKMDNARICVVYLNKEGDWINTCPFNVTVTATSSVTFNIGGAMQVMLFSLLNVTSLVLVVPKLHSISP